MDGTLLSLRHVAVCGVSGSEGAFSEVCHACFIFINLSIASKVTEIGRNSVVMYVSDQFIDGKVQLTCIWDMYAPYSAKSFFRTLSPVIG